MKTVYWYILGALVLAYFVARKFAVATVATNVANQNTANTINSLATPDAGFYAGTTADTLKPADQAKYPGYYRTDDGGWVNPDTGATFSTGSSPPALATPYAVDHPVTIDLPTAYDGGAGSGGAAPPAGYVVY
jgi:hypothetical protein